MNRKQEYLSMMEELNRPVPALEETVTRACQKKRMNTAKRIVRPMTAIFACFAVFVLLVNFSAPVAYACSQIPVLRELAAAVTFSRSLSDAVQNQYVQPMDLSQSENGITAEVDYLIVDQKQVNVFYRLDSKVYRQLAADPTVRNLDGERPPSCGWSSTGFNAENGELRCLSIDFVEDNVPGSLTIRLKVYTNEIDHENMAPENYVGEIFSETAPLEPDYLAEFEFLLEFDPKFTAAGKIFPVNEAVYLKGQAITITDIEIYPTHLRMDVTESLDNTAWLKGLEFYIETDDGMKFDPVSNGIVATGSVDSPLMMSYRADSTYFYEAEHLKIVITGAKWLRKEMERTYLNLVTGEHGVLPEGAEFVSAERKGSGWIVTFRAEAGEDNAMYQLFGHKFYDADGNEYEINQWGSMIGDEDEDGNLLFFYDEFPLLNYPYEEVWLTPQYSHHWMEDDLIVITVQ